MTKSICPLRSVLADKHCAEKGCRWWVALKAEDGTETGRCIVVDCSMTLDWLADSLHGLLQLSIAPCDCDECEESKAPEVH